MIVPVWLMALTTIVVVWAVIATIFLFYRNPLPFPDRGHRCFAVKDRFAAVAVTRVLSRMGLPERFTFDAGPTHQTLLWDNATVIIQHDDWTSTPNAISVVTADPMAAAKFAAKVLTHAGFSATIKENVLREVSDKFVLVASNAFEGWVLAFRRHALKMGKPPNKRRII